ncbi:MAG: hypothetical protein RL263_1453 [Bacteroidota bacterium]
MPSSHQLELDKSTTWFQLTALWAFVEVVLGGILHALRLPFTGVLVGGAAVFIIGAMVLHSQNPFKDIIRATGVVLIVKAGASPHSPLPAYLAVAYQGFSGALIFSLMRNFKIAAMLFSVLAMLESALQKLLTLTIMYGMAFWDALDSFVHSVLKSLKMGESHNATELVWTYILVYFFWGIFLGYRLSGFYKRLPILMSELRKFMNPDVDEEMPKEPGSRNQRTYSSIAFWIFYILMLLGMVASLAYLNNDKQNLFYVVLRSLSVTFLLFLVVNPLFKWFVRKGSQKSKNQLLVKLITEDFVILRLEYTACLKLVKARRLYFWRYIQAVEYLIAWRIQKVKNSE